VQLRTPRSSVVFRAFVASRFDGASDLAEAARSRSHIVAFQTRRPIVQPEPRSSRGDRGFAFLASCRGDARPRRSRTRSPRARWRVGARDRARPIALSGPVLGGDWGERGRGPFNRNRDPFYTQIMDLLLLAVDIQEEILHLEVAPGAQPISERALRY